MTRIESVRALMANSVTDDYTAKMWEATLMAMEYPQDYAPNPITLPAMCKCAEAFVPCIKAHKPPKAA